VPYEPVYFFGIHTPFLVSPNEFILNDVFAVPDVSEKNDKPSIKLTSAIYPSNNCDADTLAPIVCDLASLIYISVFTFGYVDVAKSVTTLPLT